jgi:Ni/Co efflux regulator RcnB
MTEETQSISRRKAFSLISAALGVALPATILAVSKAEAQTAGMERREDRRENRQDRREDRRDNRVERREERRGVVGQPAPTGGGATTSPK